MFRFNIMEKNKHHATLAEVAILVERLIPGDKATVEREIGSGYHVAIEEALPVKPKGEFEG